jgi:indole-3-glycerol phosphate synthase
MSVLDEILATTREGLPELRRRRAELEQSAQTRIPAVSLAVALRSRAVGVIAEVKRRSPSAGVINEELDPLVLSACYERGGAAAVSVLTEAVHFGGSIRDLQRVAGEVALPLLRKDFIIDECQIIEARAVGASAVLLIVRALPQPELVRLLAAAERWELDALVETHDREELDRALEAGARIVGVNARNLDDFSIDVGASLELLATVPAPVVAVAESGMQDRADVTQAAAAGADAVLIGGALAGSGDPASRLTELVGVQRRGR